MLITDKIEAPCDINRLIPITATPSEQIAAGLYRGAVITLALAAATPTVYASQNQLRRPQFALGTTPPWRPAGQAVYTLPEGQPLDERVRELFVIACREIDKELTYTDEGGAHLSPIVMAAAFARRHLASQPYKDQMPA